MQGSETMAQVFEIALGAASGFLLERQKSSELLYCLEEVVSVELVLIDFHYQHGDRLELVLHENLFDFFHLEWREGPQWVFLLF